MKLWYHRNRWSMVVYQGSMVREREKSDKESEETSEEDDELGGPEEADDETGRRRTDEPSRSTRRRSGWKEACESEEEMDERS